MTRKKAGRKTRKTPPHTPSHTIQFGIGRTVVVPPETSARLTELDSEIEYIRDKHRDLLASPAYQELRHLFGLEMQRDRVLSDLFHAESVERSARLSAIEERQRKISQQGAAARRKQAEPNRKAVCKRFRELRKTIPKKTVRHLKIAGELGISERHVKRIVNEADLD